MMMPGVESSVRIGFSRSVCSPMAMDATEILSSM